MDRIFSELQKKKSPANPKRGGMDQGILREKDLNQQPPKQKEGLGIHNRQPRNSVH